MADEKPLPEEEHEKENGDETRDRNRTDGQQKVDDKDKVLPSAKRKSSVSLKSDKTLPSGSIEPDAKTGEKELPSAREEKKEQEERREKPEVLSDEAPTTLTGDSRKDRIRAATLAGGLQKLPPGFDDDNGDWQCIKSDNVFERLYLDHTLFQHITPQLVEKNYRLLREFWEEKCALMHQGANRLRFQQKYGQKIESYPQNLHLAYKQLVEPGGIENSFLRLDADRRQRGQERLEPMLIEALDDNVLEPAEENMVKNVGRSETELTDAEIKDLIDEYLTKTNSIRGKGGGGIQEAFGQAFFEQIKMKFEANFLSRKDEAELAKVAPTMNIAPPRMDALILQALREIDGAERESTLEQDKQNFKNFYYTLLQDHSLEDGDKLPEAARTKLLEQDNSETEFFPLSQNTRTGLIQETVEKYKIDLVEEKERFYQEALEKLDVFEKHDYGRQFLLSDTAYELLLPKMRHELIETAIQEIVHKQSDLFTKAAKCFYQIEHWKPTEQETETFITDPNHPFDESWVRCDWLRREAREELFGKVTEWAQAEYDREINELRKLIQDKLKSCSYGLPLDLQLDIETDDHFHLSQQERRELVVELEQDLRKKTEVKFTELVQSNLVFQTLIPDREVALLEEGRSKYLLDAAKV
ncbi:MAG: hypothetical protein ACE5I1_12240, partial [bacterium]